MLCARMSVPNAGGSCPKTLGKWGATSGMSRANGVLNGDAMHFSNPHSPTVLDRAMTEHANALLVTYKQADGGLIFGEFSFVTELEFFDDADKPIEVVKETWQRVAVETFTVKPPWWSDDEE
jgi:hypothetical protein